MDAPAPRETAANSTSARKLFELRCGRALTDEDGREIASNLTGFFQILQEWDRRSSAADGLTEEGHFTKPNTAAQGET